MAVMAALFSVERYLSTFHYSSELFNVFDGLSTEWAIIVALLNPTDDAFRMEVVPWVAFQLSQLVTWLVVGEADLAAAFIGELSWVVPRSAQAVDHSVNLGIVQIVRVPLSHSVTDVEVQARATTDEGSEEKEDE